MAYTTSVFRREPLWKVSMNVRVQPTVRCAFVPEENAIKLILKESVEPPTDSKETDVKQDVVIYVLKVRSYLCDFHFLTFGNFLARKVVSEARL